ncbi:cobalt-precorrin-6A reductase [Streptomyces thermolineatus]|uniref:cobalt-precorrin-6A reductase n=1 Tax=Streptomyces thermolineatus TaxID=44033 RepID=UPI0031CF9A5E
MSVTRVLILGGTSEARALARLLAAEPGVEAVSSLAGRVADPLLPPGRSRVGGFGGADGLAVWLGEERVDAVVDATHPFAARITASAAAASARAGVPLLVVRRPGWEPGAGDRWTGAASLEEAAGAVPGLGERVFLTTGRQGLAAFADLDRPWFLVRTVEPPGPPLPPRAAVLCERGPFTVEGERELMLRHRIDLLVTKDSGGAMTAAKLVAARALGLPVLMVRRPPLPEGVRTVPDAAAAAGWVLEAAAR